MQYKRTTDTFYDGVMYTSPLLSSQTPRGFRITGLAMRNAVTDQLFSLACLKKSRSSFPGRYWGWRSYEYNNRACCTQYATTYTVVRAAQCSGVICMDTPFKIFSCRGIHACMHIHLSVWVNMVVAEGPTQIWTISTPLNVCWQHIRTAGAGFMVVACEAIHSGLMGLQ